MRMHDNGDCRNVDPAHRSAYGSIAFASIAVADWVDGFLKQLNAFGLIGWVLSSGIWGVGSKWCGSTSRRAAAAGGSGNQA